MMTSFTFHRMSRQTYCGQTYFIDIARQMPSPCIAVQIQTNSDSSLWFCRVFLNLFMHSVWFCEEQKSMVCPILRAVGTFLFYLACNDCNLSSFAWKLYLFRTMPSQFLKLCRRYALFKVFLHVWNPSLFQTPFDLCPHRTVRFSRCTYGNCLTKNNHFYNVFECPINNCPSREVEHLPFFLQIVTARDILQLAMSAALSAAPTLYLPILWDCKNCSSDDDSVISLSSYLRMLDIV